MSASRLNHLLWATDLIQVHVVGKLAISPLFKIDKWDRFHEKGPKACFFFVFFSRFEILLYSRSQKCPLHFASYALRIGVSVMELSWSCHGVVMELSWSCHGVASSEFLISHTFQRHFYCAYWKFYNVCVRSLFAETIPNLFCTQAPPG